MSSLAIANSQTHGEGNGTIFEPFGNGASHSDSGDFASQAKYHATDISWLQLRLFGGRPGSYCPSDQGSTTGHQADEELLSNADAPLVEEHAAYYQPAEYAKNRIATGIKAIIGWNSSLIQGVQDVRKDATEWRTCRRSSTMRTSAPQDMPAPASTKCSPSSAP